MIGGLLLTGQAAALPLPAGAGSHQDACRASALRVGGAPEAVVAGSASSDCQKHETPSAGNPVAVGHPNNSVEASGAYARTRQSSSTVSGRSGGEAEAGLTELTISHRGTGLPDDPDPGIGYMYIDFLASEATADCSSSVFSATSTSYVGRVSTAVPPNATLAPPGDSENHSHLVVAAGVTIHFNERLLSDTNGNGIDDTVTRRALWIATGDPAKDLVIAESVATQYAGGC